MLDMQIQQAEEEKPKYGYASNEKADLNAEIEQRKALAGAEDSNIEVTIDADGKQIINLVWGEFKLN